MVTSDIAGHDDYIGAVRERVLHMKDDLNLKWTSKIIYYSHNIAIFRFFIQAEVKVTKEEHIDKLVDSETRIILLYSTKDEANNIMEWARGKELTGNNYVWIVTQSVIGESRKGTASAKPQFPVGMLGKF